MRFLKFLHFGHRLQYLEKQETFLQPSYSKGNHIFRWPRSGNCKYPCFFHIVRACSISVFFS